jgi:glucoside 3-dehydrogenase (cytochrome c) hitch-hiker subunit
MSTPPVAVGLSRREVLVSSAAVALGLTLSPARIWAAAQGGNAHVGPARPLLDDLCDAVIPATDTPGARAAGVSAFVELAVAHHLQGAAEDLVTTFGAALDELAAGSYLQQPEERRRALLADIDARAFARAADESLPERLRQWPVLKALIVVGYYTSEIGGSQELRYVLVPGRFDPDVSLKPGERAWSSDWTGVKFA